MTLERRALYVDGTMATDGGFIPCIVIEDEPFLYSMVDSPRSGEATWVWGPTLRDARRMVRLANDRLFGLDDVEVAEVIAAMLETRGLLNNCDGDNCTRRDCELHYMLAPIKLHVAHDPGEPFDGGYIPVLDETVHSTPGLGFLTACDLDATGLQVTDDESKVTCKACRDALRVARDNRNRNYLD